MTLAQLRKIAKDFSKEEKLEVKNLKKQGLDEGEAIGTVVLQRMIKSLQIAA